MDFNLPGTWMSVSYLLHCLPFGPMFSLLVKHVTFLLQPDFAAHVTIVGKWKGSAACFSDGMLATSVPLGDHCSGQR